MPKHPVSILIIAITMLCHSTSAQTWKELYHEADSLSDLEIAEKLPRALELALYSLEKAEQQFGKEDSNLAPILELTAMILESGQRTSLTIGLCKQVIIVDRLENGSGNPDKALPYAERALRIRQKYQGVDHPAVARTLQLVASINFVLGRGGDAFSLVKRALLIYENRNLTEHREYAFALHNLGFLHYWLGRHQEAAISLGGAVEMMRRIVPANDRYLAFPLTFLAANYWELGLYQEAEEPLKEALRNAIDAHGPESAEAAIRMGNLSQHYSLQGRFVEYEVWGRRSFNTMIRKTPSSDPNFGRTFLGFGRSLMLVENYAAAIDTLQKAISLWETISSPEPRLVSAIEMIGKCRTSQGNYVQAEQDFLRALAVRDSLYGAESQDKSSIWLDLADTYLHLKRFQKADSLLARVLALRQLMLGSDNPSVADVLDKYSDHDRLTANIPKALDVSHQAVAIRSKNFIGNSRTMSERDALSFSMFLRRSVNNYLSSLIDAGAVGAATTRQAADIIVSTKGQTSEQSMLRRKALVTETDSATVALAEQHRYTRFQLSTLYVEGPGRKTPDQFRREIDSLENLANDLEASLARKSASFAATQHNQNVSIDQIVSHLPPASTLVEYLRMNYVKLNPDTLIPRYMALTVDASGNSRVVDLGDAEEIDRVIEDYREHFAAMAALGKSLFMKEESAYKRLSSKLYNQIWKPVEQSIPQRGTVFIAPDGGLNLVSFAGLRSNDGKYLIEKHPIQYLSAGRDLLRLNQNEPSRTGLLAFGDPDFDAPVAERISSAPQLAANIASVNPYQVRNVRSGCDLLNEMTVSRLYNTQAEAESVTDFWQEQTRQESATLLTGSKASEERFKQESPGKRIIHMATHGYFLQSSCMPETKDHTFVGENPLLQSGLLLAGANLHGEGAREAGAEDGIVTALEVSTMDLRGTDLVVLSACETGLGKVEQGEGVYGLRRAFQMAGAKTVVSSLWQVPDRETMKFMKTLYATKAKTYPELMQQVALQRIREARLRGRPTHPFSWGAFVATGEWRIR